MKLLDLVGVLASTTIISVRLHENRVSKTASQWYESRHDWLEREVEQVQVEVFLYNTISILLNHTEEFSEKEKK